MKIILLLVAVACVSCKKEYGIRMRWTSNAHNCTDTPAAIEYWPIGSAFAETGHGSCVDVALADGGHAYYTYSKTNKIPEIPSSWSPFYAVETFYENENKCEKGKANDVLLTSFTNSDSCIFMGASTEGYFYQKLDCTSADGGVVLSCKDSACTDCRAPDQYQGGCEDFVNSVHSCAANPSSTETPKYGLRMRWVSNANGCTGEPDSIDYWPIGSPFAEEGTGSCVDVALADGGHAYYTYTTSVSAPAVPSSWSPFYAVETYYEDQPTCEAADPSTVDLVTIQNSNSCIFMGASTMGYFYQKLDCTSATGGVVLSCKDAACTDCRTPFQYQGGCDDFVNSVHACAAH